MREEILVSSSFYETRVAIIESSIVQELHIERSDSKSVVGNIYLGVVSRVLPGIQSAFVEIGLERTAFLHLTDLIETKNNIDTHVTSIEQVISEGQPLLVQVVKAPLGSKGARLSTQISLVGRLLIYLPQESHLAVSQKITSEEERTRLKNFLQTFLSQSDCGGYIIRTSAESIAEPSFEEDLDYLRKLWAKIFLSSQKATAPSLLYRELSLEQRILRDTASRTTEAIWIDDSNVFSEVQDFCTSYIPVLLNRLNFYVDSMPLFVKYSVEEEIKKALNKRVDLPSGGYLIIDQTEAMTTIDVNTGSYVGGGSFDETVLNTNLEAAKVIPRQLRLRSLAGIIVVDFIDMIQSENCQAVLEVLRERLSKDRIKSFVNSFTPLGLVEITRKRIRESLAQVMCSICPTCQGRAYIKSPKTTAYEIMREIERGYIQGNMTQFEFKVFASETVVELFKNGEAHNLDNLMKTTGCLISLEVQQGFSSDKYHLVSEALC